MSGSSVSAEKEFAPRIQARKIKLGDVPEIAAIQEAILQKKVSQKWVQMVKKYLEDRNRIGFVALKGSRLVGFIIGEIKGEGFGLEQSGWINWVGVDPREMGTGIGKTLSVRIFDYFRKKSVKDIYTSVRWDAGDMLSFFKSIGFDRSPFINLTKRLE